jgi:hypothetical protein
MQREIEIELFPDNRHQHVRGDGNPDLTLDRIFGCAKEALDAKMLLDSFEEEFHLPAALVKGTDSQCGDPEMVGQKHEGLAGFGILEANAA